MNILFLTNKSAFTKGAFGGAESSIKLLAETFVAEGHKVVYFTKDPSGIFFPRFQSFNINGINLHIFQTTYRYRRNKTVKQFNDWILERRLSKIIDAENIQIAYCFYELENVQLLLKISANNKNLRIVMRMAGLHWFEACIKNRKLIKQYNDIFNKVHGVNYISSGLESMVSDKMKTLNMHVRHKYTFIADIGSSVKPGRTKDYAILPNSPFKIVMATRFSNYQKRQDILMQAASLVKNSYSLCFFFIGDGVSRKKIELLAAELGLTDRVSFLPFMPQKDLWHLLQNSNLLCHAVDYEGLGKIIIESMAIGLPVLASDVAPLNTYIEDSKNGFLVENDPLAWARKIESLIDDKSLRIDVSSRAIEWVKENYCPRKNLRIYEENFNNIITKN